MMVAKLEYHGPLRGSRRHWCKVLLLLMIILQAIAPSVVTWKPRWQWWLGTRN